MQSQHSLPTELSLQMAPIPQDNLPPPQGFILDKIKAHLAFTEQQFLRNIDWQRQLLNKIQLSQKARQVTNSSSFQLNVQEQNKLHAYLEQHLGQKARGLNLRELIQNIQVSRGSGNRIPECTFGPQLCHSSKQQLAFPAVQRVITLNDLAPSTRRQLTATPPTLPPRTPKVNGKRSRQTNQAQVLPLTPEPRIERSQQLEHSAERVQSESQKETSWGKRGNCEEMGDSLGRRLFRQKQNLIEEVLVGSQISLNLSSSKGQESGKMGLFQRLQPDKILAQSFRQSGNFERESLFLHINQQPKQEERIFSNSGENCLSKFDGLCFRELPRRKIGHCVVKKERFVSYEKTGSDKVRKLQDSFGHAYQEYYIEESLCCMDRQSSPPVLFGKGQDPTF